MLSVHNCELDLPGGGNAM